MTELEALLQAVYANPADDLPRLVLADWCDEHGEPERADLIRVQCELTRHPDRPDLLDREEQLLADPAPLLDPEDRAAFAVAAFNLVFARGFLTGAVFPDYDPERQTPAIFPVEEVGNDWHRLCDLAARNPPFEDIECPGWFGLTAARDPLGQWVTLLEYERPRSCPMCDGDGWLRRTMVCPQCDGSGTADTPMDITDQANPWQTGRIRWYIGRALFGHDHPHFQCDPG